MNGRCKQNGEFGQRQVEPQGSLLRCIRTIHEQRAVDKKGGKVKDSRNKRSRRGCKDCCAESQSIENQMGVVDQNESAGRHGLRCLEKTLYAYLCKCREQG